jgi:hypothetical protein
MAEEKMISRRNALIAGAAGGGALLLSSAAQAQRSAKVVKTFTPPRQIKNVDHAVVYRNENHFCAWPYTRGYWNFGDGELVQSFDCVNTDYANPDAINHNKMIDTAAKIGASATVKMTVRSKDWGKTWDGANPVIDIYDKIAKGTEKAKTLADLGPIDYLNKDVLVLNAPKYPGFLDPAGRCGVKVSRDRGHTWSPEFPLAMEGLHSISGINSSLVRPDGTVLIFLTEVTEKIYDRHPLIYALPPSGTEFRFLSYITPKADPFGTADGEYGDTPRFGGHRWFYPRGYMLASGRMLCVTRGQRDPRGDMWVEVFYSDDGGETWGFLSRVNDFGSPGSLVVKKDGRFVMVYGYRLMPSGMRCRVSEDEGKTWGPELIIRDDGGSWDLGYGDAWEMPDGKIGVIYYFNSKNDKVKVNGGVRHICRSIFSVDA